MKCIFTIVLITLALVQTGVIDLPDQLSALLSPSEFISETGNQTNMVDDTGSDNLSEVRFPLQKPRGAFLQMLFEIFDLS